MEAESTPLRSCTIAAATSSWYSRLAASRLSRFISINLYAVRNKGTSAVTSSTASSVQTSRTRRTRGDHFDGAGRGASSGDMRHGPQPPDGVFEPAGNFIDVRFGGDPPEAKSHRGVGPLVRGAERLHHVGRLAGFVGAGRAARHRDGAERRDQPFRLHVLK